MSTESVTEPPAQQTGAPQRLPLVTDVLTAGVFLMGTTEFIVAGILPEISQSLGVSVADTGLMITIFAIGMIVGTPTMAIATLKLPRRTTLTLALLVFAIGHLIVALASSFALILAARFLTALATGAFWAVAAVVAAKAAGAQSSKALGIVLGGGMLANALGVPLGSFVGQAMGWRSPFWALAVLSALTAVLVFRMVADDRSTEPAPSIKAELNSLKDVRVWLVLFCCAVVCGSSLAAYSYISPLLTERAGLPAGAVPLVLLVYGVGALVGSMLGGSLGAARPYAVLFTAATGTFVTLALLIVGSTQPVLTVFLVALLGLFGTSTNPILIAKGVGYADQAPTLASAMCTSFFNVGTAVGSLIAGRALETSLGVTGPVVVGAVIALLYFIPLPLLLVRDRRVAAVAPGAAAAA